MPYIVMERLPGRTVADEIAHGPLPQPAVRAILGELLDALAVAHDAGILHRDIKPANILYTDLRRGQGHRLRYREDRVTPTTP